MTSTQGRVLAISLCVVTLWCGGARAVNPSVRIVEVEIVPGKFLAFERQDWTVDNDAAVRRSGVERTRLRIPYRGDDVRWEGLDIPILLREHDGRLYMVGVLRDTREDEIIIHRNFRYYVLKEDRAFHRIPPAEFPKAIAVQNLWINAPDVLEAIRDFDIESLSFRTSLNAQVWHELLTGEASPEREVDVKVLRQFVERHRPAKLKHIVRPPATTRSAAGR